MGSFCRRPSLSLGLGGGPRSVPVAAPAVRAKGGAGRGSRRLTESGRGACSLNLSIVLWLGLGAYR